MSQPQNDTSGFFGGVPDALKFDKVGDGYTFSIADKEIRQQRELRDDGTMGDLQYWPDGRRKMMAVLTVWLSPTYRDGDDDDGKRTLYVRGHMQRDFTDGVRKANRRDLLIGDVVDMVRTEDIPAPEGSKLNPTQTYSVTIK